MQIKCFHPVLLGKYYNMNHSGGLSFNHTSGSLKAELYNQKLWVCSTNASEQNHVEHHALHGLHCVEPMEP